MEGRKKRGGEGQLISRWHLKWKYLKKKKKKKLCRQCLWRRCFVKKKRTWTDFFPFLFYILPVLLVSGGVTQGELKKTIYAPPLNRYSDDDNLFSKRAHSWEYFFFFFFLEKKDRENQSSHKLVTGRHAWDTFSVWGCLCVHRTRAERERECIVVLLFTTF